MTGDSYLLISGSCWNRNSEIAVLRRSGILRRTILRVLIGAVGAVGFIGSVGLVRFVGLVGLIHEYSPPLRV